MTTIPCGINGSCPYEYQCITNACQHIPIFPIQGYPIAIYCLFPFASAICNISGNSFGEFKVLLMMDALNYSQSMGTTLCYPLILGTALYNVVNLVFKRHPSKPTSLVDYNIVTIIIPNVLIGSTIGSFVNSLLPPIVADCLIIALLLAFSVKFFFKLKALFEQDKQTPSKSRKTLLELPKKQLTEQDIKSIKAPLITSQPQTTLNKQSLTQEQKSSDLSALKESQLSNPFQQQLDQHIIYQSGYHLKHILGIILLFIVFQALAFLAQGRIVYFSFCSEWYAIGLSSLVAVYLGIMVLVFRYTKAKMEHYKKIGWDYSYPLQNIKFFIMVCAGSFLGGFNGGAFALGNSTTIIFTLIYLEVEPMIVSATVGFQVVFAAAASLMQAIIQESIPYNVIGFFVLLTLIGGGTLSFISGYFINKLDRDKVNKIVVIIVATLTLVSALSMMVNIAISYKSFGGEYMKSSPGLCK